MNISMNAIDISGQAPGGKRTPLVDVLPLKTPFVVQIFPIYACNFKCRYCIFSLPKEKRGFISDVVSMDLALFKKCADEMAKFPEKIKVLRFVGIGEPLLHKQIVEMISYAVKKDIAWTVELLTNGSLLTPEMSDRLIGAGLSRLVVSIQGITAEKYREVSSVDLDMEKLVENLRYFYEHRGNIRMYLKIVDIALDSDRDRDKFYLLFGDITETIGVENTVPIHEGVLYSGILKDKGKELTQFGFPVQDVPVCPQPFFTMQINPDGNVVPCFSFEYPEIIGNVITESAFDIWNGGSFRKFRRKMLDGVRFASEICSSCNIIRYRFFPEDGLCYDVDRLKPMYE